MRTNKTQLALVAALGLALGYVGVPAIAQAAFYLGTLVNTSARTSSVTTLVKTGTPCVSMPSTPLTGRRAIEIYNGGTEALWCTTNGTCPASSGDGRKIAAGESWSLDIGEAIIPKCLTLSAQLDGGTTVVTETR